MTSQVLTPCPNNVPQVPHRPYPHLSLFTTFIGNTAVTKNDFHRLLPPYLPTRQHLLPCSAFPHDALMSCVSTHSSVKLGLASLFYFQQVSLPLYTN